MIQKGISGNPDWLDGIADWRAMCDCEDEGDELSKIGLTL